MASINSRNKGAQAEREIVGILREHGFGARRTAQMQSQIGAPESDVAISVEGLFLEVKRQERVQIDKWCAQVELAAKPTDVPAVVWRRSRERWRVALPLQDFLELVKRASL